jgi:hypothetical protein
MDFSRPSFSPWRWLTLVGKRGENLLSEPRGEGRSSEGAGNRSVEA